MRPAIKVAVVGVGYLAAFVVAWVALTIRQAHIDPADLQASGGMYAFGDATLFCAVFGIASLVPTGLALFFLRPCAWFWKTFSALGLALGFTGIIAVILYALGKTAPTSVLGHLGAFSVLRLLAAPVFALGFLLCAVLAPDRSSRRYFGLAAAMDVTACIYFGLSWFIPMLLHR